MTTMFPHIQQQEEKFQIKVTLREPAAAICPPVREEIHTVATIPASRPIPPGAVLLASSPVAVLAAMALCAGFLAAFQAPLHAPEMLTAGAISVIGGMMAVLPLFNAMRIGDGEKMLRGAMASIAIRIVLLLAGAYIAIGPGFGLDRTALIYWVLAFYFPMLAVETGTMAWILRKLDEI